MKKDAEDKNTALPEFGPVVTGIAQLVDTKIYYEILGEGHPLVLIQDNGLLDLRLWDDQFAELAKHYKVIRYDARGVRKSEVNREARMSIYYPQQDLYQLLKFLDIEKTYLLGLSKPGGVIAIDFTIEHPEMIDKLILASSGLNGYKSLDEALTIDLPRLLEKFAPAAEALQDGNFEKAVHVFMEDSSAPLDEYPLACQKAQALMTENILSLFLSPPPPPVMQIDAPNQRQHLSEINVPTLIIVGEIDSEEVHAIANVLQSEILNAKIIVIPNTRYLMNMEKPEIFNKIVVDFLG